MFCQFLLYLSLIFVVSTEIFFLAVDLPLKGQKSPPNAVWPHPQQVNISDELLYVRPRNLRIGSNIETCDIISKAIARYQAIFFPPKISMQWPPYDAKNILESLTLRITDGGQCEQHIQENSNETYNLAIRQQNAVVEASTIWGLLRGIETFSQLLYINEQNYVCSCLSIPCWL